MLRSMRGIARPIQATARATARSPWAAAVIAWLAMVAGEPNAPGAPGKTKDMNPKELTEHVTALEEQVALFAALSASQGIQIADLQQRESVLELRSGEQKAEIAVLQQGNATLELQAMKNAGALLLLQDQA